MHLTQERKMMAEMQKMQAMMKKMEEDHKKALAMAQRWRGE